MACVANSDAAPNAILPIPHNLEVMALFFHALDCLPEGALVSSLARAKEDGPLGENNATADRALLEVARYRFLPSSITTQQFFNALQATDPASGQSRGFRLVSR
jgi:hypothetical protein